VEIPESCADGIDQMIETATIIKEEVREKRTSWMQYTLESNEFLRFGIQAYTENYTSCKVRQKADHDASKSCKTLLTAVKANRTLLYESLTTNPNDLVLLCSQLLRKESALNERVQECGRALDSVESFSCSSATCSRLDAPRMTRALRVALCSLGCTTAANMSGFIVTALFSA